MGEALRGRVQNLCGVDLSAKMIAQAGERGAYDELQVADIVEYLGETQSRFDLIVAADVFVYLGELAPVFALAAARLDEDGAFIFSTELASEGTFSLRDTGRYAHSEAYLATLALQHGMRVVSSHGAINRRQREAPVDGSITLLSLT